MHQQLKYRLSHKNIKKNKYTWHCSVNRCRHRIYTTLDANGIHQYVGEGGQGHSTDEHKMYDNIRLHKIDLIQKVFNESYLQKNPYQHHLVMF